MRESEGMQYERFSGDHELTAEQEEKLLQDVEAAIDRLPRTRLDDYARDAVAKFGKGIIGTKSLAFALRGWRRSMMEYSTITMDSGGRVFLVHDVGTLILHPQYGVFEEAT